MILYSIVPSEVIFGGQESEAVNNELRDMDYLGEKVQVSPLINNRFVIKRLISTNPRAYLNPMLQPGAIIEPGI